MKAHDQYAPKWDTRARFYHFPELALKYGHDHGLPREEWLVKTYNFPIQPVVFLTKRVQI